MDRLEAKKAYEAEWPALNAVKEAAVERGTNEEARRARQALSALSIKYADRHIIEPPPITIGERLDELESRVARLERG